MRIKVFGVRQIIITRGSLRFCLVKEGLKGLISMVKTCTNSDDKVTQQLFNQQRCSCELLLGAVVISDNAETRQLD